MMRNNPLFKEGKVSAKDARIFWDAELGEVSVVEVGKPLSVHINNFSSSGGACYAKWRTDCRDSKTAQILCLHEFWNLVYIFGLEPEVVDKALRDIVEYQQAFKTALNPL